MDDLSGGKLAGEDRYGVDVLSRLPLPEGSVRFWLVEEANLSAEDKYKVGDTVALLLLRGGRRREVKVTLVGSAVGNPINVLFEWLYPVYVKP